MVSIPQKERKLNWLVVGAGAIGSAVGGFLAKSGETVWLLGRSWHLEKVRQQGLLIHGILGEHRVRVAGTATRFEELPRLSWDRILVTVKSTDTTRALAKAIRPLLSTHTLVISLQNGLGNWETLASRIPVQQLVGGRVIFGVELEPGEVTITVWGGEILLGLLDARLSLAALQAIAKKLSQAGLKTKVVPKIREALWGKVIYNCALNPLSTLREVPYGKLLKSTETRNLMKQIVQEAYAVAKPERIRLTPPTATSYIQLLFKKLIPATAKHYPSMLQDVRRGRPTEIDALNGAIVRLGQKHRLPTPANAFLTELIHARESIKEK